MADQVRTRLRSLALGTSALALASTAAIAPATANDVGDPIRDIIIWSRPQAANPQAFQAAELIAQAWRELGLQVEVRGIPRPQQSDIVWFNRDSWDTTMWQMVGRAERSDPDELVFNLFHSSTAESGFNFVGFNSEEYDRLVEAQRLATDPDERRELIQQAQRMIAAEQPYMFLVHPTQVYAFNSSVWDPETIIEQAGLGIKNFWTYISATPVGSQRDMILNSSDELNAISPMYISGASDSWVTELIWDRLMRIGPDGLPQPWSAESYEWVDDVTLELTLREGMTWHDGEPVTVEDVIFSFEAPAMGDKVPMYRPFVQDIESIEAVDDRTVRMVLRQPNASFLTSSIAKINLVPKHVWGPIMEDLMDRPENAESVVEESRIGSGPFRFVEWSAQQQVVLEANPDHWAAPNMDRWILRIVPNVEAALGMLRSGSVNFMSDYTGDPEILMDIAARDPNIETVQSVDIGFQFLAFNNRRPPFSDANFRRALSFAVPRELMMAAAWNGFAVPANSMVSPVLDFWHYDGVLPIEAGVEVARRHLEAGGFKLVNGRLHYPAGMSETLTSSR